jgi:tetratricopeptide (TPR) repeat protein
MKIIPSIFLLLLTVSLSAQTPVDGFFSKKIDEAVDLMNIGEYEKANEGFTYVLKNITSVPTDLAYYFGKNSYYLKKYKQSINWLNKYIQLKGTRGRFYDDAVETLNLAEDSYINNAKETAENMQEDMASGEFDCGGMEKILCPVCKGEGVVFKKGPFETLYQTCPYSEGKPYISCSDYNLFMKGELEPKIKY